MTWKENLAITRRDALLMSGAAAASGIAGLASGYRFRHELHDVWRATLAGGSLDTPGAAAFAAEREQIMALRKLQTPEIAASLKRRYAKPVIGPMDMWALIERLSDCIDASDLQLFTGSQLVHVKQVIAAMEREGVTDSNLFLVALLHDVGKVAISVGGAPEHFLGSEMRLGEGRLRAGLENIEYAFGHASFMYERIKDHVPEPVAWTVRYHNIDLDDAVPFMSSKDHDYAERYLRPFRRFDNGFKSYNYAPSVDMGPYRNLIEEYFSKSILF